MHPRAARSRPLELRRASSSTAKAPATRRPASTKWNRAYGVDANCRCRPNQRVSDVLRARPIRRAPIGSDYSGRAFYNFTQQPLADLRRLLAGRRALQSRRSASCRAAAIAGRSSAPSSSRSRRSIKWIRRFSPHVCYNAFCGLRRRAADLDDAHPLLRDPAEAGRPVRLLRRSQPGQPADAVRGLQPRRQAASSSRRASTPGGQQASSTCTTRARASPARVALRFGNYYDGDFKALELTSDYRITRGMTASVGWTRQDIDLPGGVVRHRPGAGQGVSYSFTTLASLLGAGAVQRPDGAVLVEHPPRPAQPQRHRPVRRLQRPPRRPELTSYETLGRSFIVKVHAAVRFLEGIREQGSDVRKAS